MSRHTSFSSPICTKLILFRGLWALIMVGLSFLPDAASSFADRQAQTGMGVYTGEQIGSFFLRMSGTVLGLVIGMVAWYIGAGRGPGNPYGVAASTVRLHPRPCSCWC